jgi:hypothetical protein
VVTGDEFLAHAERLVRDPEWPPGERRHLTDLRSAILEPTIDGVVNEAADLFGAHPLLPRLRHAIVAGDVYERAGRFERMIKRYRTFTFVFNSLNPACEWLGGNAKYVERILE